ncbi:MAG: glucosaminidase domain-containing protein [Paludibacteraceae bacterium]|nr:glucosaminidase domain-containing protein [Paludibacteraceae bacterium]
MNRLFHTIVILLLNICALFAVSYRSAETIEYIERYHKTAIREMYLYNIPASITLAQGILESGSGRSDLAIRANNHFGIKCSDGYKGKTYHKDDDKRHDCFRVYDSADESFRDHSLFLQRPHYADLFKLRITDYKGWAKGLKKAGYATNPKYPELLIEVIEQNYLDIYDRNPEQFLSRDGSDPQDKKKELREKERREEEKREAERRELKKREQEQRELQRREEEKQKPYKEIKKKEAPSKVKADKVNGVRYLVVKQGDTFYGLSKKAGISVEKLKSYNDFPANYVLKAGERVYIEPKKKSGATAHHKIAKGDTWHSISQKYAVQLASLKAMNKKVKFKVGAKVRLR